MAAQLPQSFLICLRPRLHNRTKLSSLELSNHHQSDIHQAHGTSIYDELTASDALKDLTTLRKFCGEQIDACIAKENKDEFSFFYVGELCAFWIRLITRKGDYDMYLNAYTKEENYQKYFDFLEKLRQSGETNMYGAAPYLQSEFPELRGSQKKANAILIAWIKSFEMKEGGEPC